MTKFDECYQMSLEDLLSDTVYIAEKRRIKHSCKKYSFRLRNMITNEKDVVHLGKYYYFNRTKDDPTIDKYNDHSYILSIDRARELSISKILEYFGNKQEVLSTLYNLLNNAGLLDVLLSGEYTLFAPTNDAFSNVNLNSLNPEELKEILKYHVVPGKIMSSDLATYSVNLGTANVLSANIVASNGVIHLIDSLLLSSALEEFDIEDEGTASPTPKPLPSILDIITTSADHTILRKALETADLISTLTAGINLTVFAPTNTAFNNLLKEKNISLDQLLVRDDLREILLYHVLSEIVMSSNLDTVLRDGLSISKILQNNNAAALKLDIEANNGVVHIIDTVLLPSAPPTPAPTTPAPTTPAPTTPAPTPPPTPPPTPAPTPTQTPAPTNGQLKVQNLKKNLSNYSRSSSFYTSCNSFYRNLELYINETIREDDLDNLINITTLLKNQFCYNIDINYSQQVSYTMQYRYDNLSDGIINKTSFSTVQLMITSLMNELNIIFNLGMSMLTNELKSIISPFSVYNLKVYNTGPLLHLNNKPYLFESNMMEKTENQVKNEITNMLELNNYLIIKIELEGEAKVNAAHPFVITINDTEYATTYNNLYYLLKKGDTVKYYCEIFSHRSVMYGTLVE